MPLLLIQSCSQSKRESSKPTPAIDLYTGYFYKIINKARNEGELRDDIEIRILSAEHGLIAPDTEIASYDRRMDSSRATELNEQVVPQLSETVDTLGVDEVVINGGKEYRQALTGVEESVPDPVSVRYIRGGGIGEMGSQLKSLIRTDQELEAA